MGKKTIKINEEQLRQLIEESVKRVLREDFIDDIENEHKGAINYDVPEYDEKDLHIPYVNDTKREKEDKERNWVMIYMEYNRKLRSLEPTAGDDPSYFSSTKEEAIKDLTNDVREFAKVTPNGALPVFELYEEDGDFILAVALDPHDEKIKKDILDYYSGDEVIFV